MKSVLTVIVPLGIVVGLAPALQGCKGAEEIVEKPKGQMPPIQEPTADQAADRTKMMSRDK